MNYLLEPFYGGNSVFLCGAVCVLLVIILLAVISFSNKAWNAKSFDLDTYSIGVTSWVVELVQQRRRTLEYRSCTSFVRDDWLDPEPSTESSEYAAYIEIEGLQRLE